MKWKSLTKNVATFFLVGFAATAFILLIPFFKKMVVTLHDSSIVPHGIEDAAVLRQNMLNRQHYFDVNALGNAKELVHNIDQVPEQGGWINTAPLDLNWLAKHGRFVLVDFWSYSRISSYRLQPYIEALWTRYKDYGLVVVGVHTPSFDFERDPQNILQAVRNQHITYPVLTDGKKDIWNKFDNHDWASNYLMNPQGNVVYKHFGEGDFADEEKTIRKKLADAGWTLPAYTPLPSLLEFKQVPVTTDLFLGTRYLRRRLGNEMQPVLNKTQYYALPKTILPDRVYLEGKWKASGDYLQAISAGQVVLNWLGNSVYIVMNKATEPLWVEVQQNGAAIPLAIRGKDIIERDGKTYLHITQPRLYFPVKDNAPYERSTLTLITPAGLQAYLFNFGVYI